jgi:hypothetical protein
MLIQVYFVNYKITVGPIQKDINCISPLCS